MQIEMAPVVVTANPVNVAVEREALLGELTDAGHDLNEVRPLTLNKLRLLALRVSAPGLFAAVR